MSLSIYIVRPGRRLTVVPIVLMLLLTGGATTLGNYHAGTAPTPVILGPVPQRGSATNNSTNSSQPGSSATPGGIVATLVLLNGTVIPGNYLGSGVGVVDSAIVYDSGDGQLYVPNSAQSNSTFPNSLVGFYGSNESITLKVPVGLEPDAVAYDSSNGYLYVANLGSANVSVVSPTNGSVVATVAVGQSPEAVVFDPQSGYLFVACSNGNVTVIDGTNQTQVSSITLGGEPDAAVYDSSNGDVYVASALSKSLAVINGTTASVVGSVAVGEAGVSALAVDPTRGILYATGSDLSQIFALDLANNTTGTTIPDAFSPAALEYDPLNGYLYVANQLGINGGNVTAVNTTTESIVGSVDVGSSPSGIAVDLANADVFIANSASGTVSVLDPSANGTLQYLSSVTINPQFSNLGANQSESMSATAVCYQSSCGPGANFTWQLANADGSLNRTTGTPVTFLAGTIEGNETITVRASLHGSVATATAIVNISSPLQSVRISPAMAVVPAGGNATFDATVNCTSGICSPTLSLVWSLNNSDGSLNTTLGAAVEFVAGLAEGNTTLSVSAHLDGLEVVGTAQISIVARSFGASLSESISSGTTPLTVSFNATGIGGSTPYTFVWAFGDGLTGTGADVQHTYTAAGSYSVVLIGYDASNQTTHLTANVVAYAPNQATASLAVSISGTPVTGPAPLTTRLRASVTGGSGPYTVEWNFGDNSTPANGASVSHTYGVPGVYVATLFVNDSSGYAAETGVFISVLNGSGAPSPLRVEVTVLSLRGTAPLTVQFIPAVLGGTPPYNLSWEFGDGSASLTTHTVGGVSYVFSSPGTFFPTLVVRDASGAVATWTAKSSSHPLVVVSSSAPAKQPWPALVWVAFVSLAAIGLIVFAIVRRAPRATSASLEASPYGAYQIESDRQPVLTDLSLPALHDPSEEDAEGDML